MANSIMQMTRLTILISSQFILFLLLLLTFLITHSLTHHHRTLLMMLIQVTWRRYSITERRRQFALIVYNKKRRSTAAIMDIICVHDLDAPHSRNIISITIIFHSLLHLAATAAAAALKYLRFFMTICTIKLFIWYREKNYFFFIVIASYSVELYKSGAHLFRT